MSSRLSRYRLAGVVVVAGMAASVAQGQQVVIDSPVLPRTPGVVEKFTAVGIDYEAFRTLPTNETTVMRNFPLGNGRRVDLEVIPFDVLTPDAAVVTGTEAGDVAMERPELVTVRGRVVGEKVSSVFLGVSPLMAHGSIQIGEETFYLSSGPWELGGDFMVFSGADLPVAKPFPVLPCGVDELPNGGVIVPSDVEMSVRGGPECRAARIAVDTVWEHTRNLFGGDTHAAATYDLILMAAISEIYTRDFDLHISVPYLRVWAGDTDPYNLPAGDILSQFRNHWSANMNHVSRTLAHIFTPDGLNGAGGVAWLGTVCNNNYGYGASAYIVGTFPYPLINNHGGNWDLMVAAHEIGHNFGAPHTHDYTNPIVDGCGNGDCSLASSGTIMSYCHTCSGGLGNIALRFHQRSITDMTNHMANARSCQTLGQSYPTMDYANAMAGMAKTIDVLSNDNVGSCGTWSILSFSSSTVFGGSVTRSVGTGPEGRDELIYTSLPGFAGTDRFSYTVQMPGRSNQQVNVTVRVDQPRPAVALRNVRSSIDVSYYVLVNPSTMPDFAAMTPYRSGLVSSVNYPSTNGNFATSSRADGVGAVFSGYIQAPTTGYYTLSVESDDGSRLYLGNDLIVNNDGLHGMEERSARVALAAGMHPIRVEFFENGGGAGCIVRWESNGISRQTIPASRWFRGDTCLADWNGSGTVNSQDFFDFLNQFFNGNADFNADGATNSQDFFDFMNGFFAGC